MCYRKRARRLKKIVADLEAQGCWFFYSGCEEDSNISYLDKIDPAGDPNNFENYKPEDARPDDLFVNSGDRTVRDVNSPQGWRHDSRASKSWAIPVLSGYYVLACQVDPTMTKGRFMRIARETAREVNSLKIIDINALLQEVAKEKANNNK